MLSQPAMGQVLCQLWANEFNEPPPKKIFHKSNPIKSPTTSSQKISITKNSNRFAGRPCPSEGKSAGGEWRDQGNLRQVVLTPQSASIIIPPYRSKTQSRMASHGILYHDFKPQIKCQYFIWTEKLFRSSINIFLHPGRIIQKLFQYLSGMKNNQEAQSISVWKEKII